jgi:histidinol-phosphate aminotransferase
MFNKRLVELKAYVLSKRFDSRSCRQIMALDWNESAFGPSNNVREDILSYLATAKLNLYPDGDSDELKNVLSEHLALTPDNILTFNGSDSAIRDCMYSLIEIGDRVGVIEPEYNQVDVFIQMAGGEKISIYPTDTFNLNIEEICKTIKDSKCKLLYLSNPSNPVGRFLESTAIEKLLSTGVTLLLDEAYVEFVSKSYVEMINQYQNLFIFRTFSKAFGLAAFRLGYLCSNPQNIRHIAKIRNPKEINTLSQVAALSALKNYGEVLEQIVAMKNSKRDFIEYLRKASKYANVRDSNANFVLFTHTNIKLIINRLREKGIYIRDRQSMYQLSSTARITIGKPHEMAVVGQVIFESE